MTQHTVRILRKNDDSNDEENILTASDGANLRRILLKAGFSPYAPLTQRLNCGGRGICATCGVWIEKGEKAPTHWHDKVGNRFGYPRLSCQITIRDDMTIRLIPEKWIWGRRRPKRQSNFNLKSG